MENENIIIFKTNLTIMDVWTDNKRIILYDHTVEFKMSE
jgi:hypothetical protein